MTRAAILHTIAGYELAVGASTSVPGMEGFAEFYLQKLDRAEIKLLNEYNDVRRSIAKDTADRFEAEIRAESAAAVPSVPPLSVS